MTARAAWRWSVLAGIVAFACSWGFGRIPGLVACGPTGGLSPIIGFEFARTPGDVAALFGSEPCRSTLIAAQKTGLLLDGLGFIPGYTAFLVLAAIAASAPGKVRTLVVAALLVAGLCDEIEGLVLHSILQQIPGTPGQLATLFWPVHVKFVLLALGSFAIGALLISARRPLAMLAGTVVAAGASWALYGLVADLPRMMSGFTIAWFTLLATAITASFLPWLFSDRAARPPAPAHPSA